MAEAAKYRSLKNGRSLKKGLLSACAVFLLSASVFPSVANAATLYLLTGRSSLVKSARPMGEVIVADPSVADVHAHGTGYLSVVGKKIGATTIRVFDKERKLLQTYDVSVGYDLVTIRRALKNFLPDELIGVEMVGSNIAVTGQVSNATSADKAVRIVSEFLKETKSGTPDASNGGAGGGGLMALMAGNPGGGAGGAMPGKEEDEYTKVLNLLQVTSGQQVMLRVRVGEVQREALKRLGVDLGGVVGATDVLLGTGGGIAGIVTPTDPSEVDILPGQITVEGGQTTDKYRGLLGGTLTSGKNKLTGVIKALERDGLFKLLAEPNLVAISGEQAEFLAGGEIPIPVPQNAGGSNNTLTIEYKPFGVAVKFRPFVLTENRIRMEVQPEVSELDSTNALRLSGFTVPALSTRRAKTTVELSPGESFMIAGLIKDQTRSTIDQLPGVKELPVLGALFRSTEFQRNETELVIAVTPYIVDPVKGGDVRLPTDNFAPASQMESFFYGALGSLSGNTPQLSQTPSVEGPIGFMVD